MQRSLRHIADFIHAIGDGEYISTEIVRGSEPFSLSSCFRDGGPSSEVLSSISSDYSAFRVFLYQTLRLLGEHRSLPVVAAEDTIASYRAQRNRVLETELRRLLASRSWRATRILRQINNSFKQGESPNGAPPVVAHCGRKEDDEQLSYNRHLKRSIRRVKYSRSWKLTKPFRVFASLFD